jgi:hypothetical protein
LSGELGDGKYRDSDTPVLVDGGKWKSIACGLHYSLAVTESGDLYSWGANDSGQLGNGSACDDYYETVSWAQADISSSVEDMCQPRVWGSQLLVRPATAVPYITFSNEGNDSGSGVTASVTQVDFTIQKIVVTNGGSGYTSPPSVSFVGGGGIGATAIAVIRGGSVVAVIPDPIATSYLYPFSARFYSSAPQVVFTGGGGVGASANAVMRGPVASVQITNAGSGYQNPPYFDIKSDGISLLDAKQLTFRKSNSVFFTRLAASSLQSCFLTGKSSHPIAIKPASTGKVIGALGMHSRNGAGFGEASASACGSGNFNAFTSPSGLLFTFGCAWTGTYGDGVVVFNGETLLPTVTASVVGGGGSGTRFSASASGSSAYTYTSNVTVSMTSSGSGHVTDPVLKLEGVGWYEGQTYDFLRIKDAVQSASDYRWLYTGMTSTGYPPKIDADYNTRKTTERPEGFVVLFTGNLSNTSTIGYPIVSKSGYAPVKGGGGTGAKCSVTEWVIPKTGETYWTYTLPQAGSPDAGKGYDSAPDWPPNVTLTGKFAVKDDHGVAYVPLVIDGPATSVSELSLPKLYAMPRSIKYGENPSFYDINPVADGGGGFCSLTLNNDAGWRRLQQGYDDSGLLVPNIEYNWGSIAWMATVGGVSVQSPGQGYRARPILYLVNPVGKPNLVGSGWSSVSAKGGLSCGVKSDGSCYWWGKGTGFYSPRLQGGEVRILSDLLPSVHDRYISISAPDSTGLPAFAAISQREFYGWPDRYACIDGKFIDVQFINFTDVDLGAKGLAGRYVPTSSTPASGSAVITAPDKRPGKVRCVSVINLSGGYTSQPSIEIVRNSSISQILGLKSGSYVNNLNYYSQPVLSLSFNNAGPLNSYPSASFQVSFSQAPTASKLAAIGVTNTFKSQCVSSGSLYSSGKYQVEGSAVQLTGVGANTYSALYPAGLSDYGCVVIRQRTRGSVVNLRVQYSGMTLAYTRDQNTGLKIQSQSQSRTFKVINTIGHKTTSDYLPSAVFLGNDYSVQAQLSASVAVLNDGTATFDAFVLNGTPVDNWSAGLFWTASGFKDVLDGYAVATDGSMLYSSSTSGAGGLILASGMVGLSPTYTYCDLVSFQSCFISTDGEYWNPGSEKLSGELEVTVADGGSGYCEFPSITSNTQTSANQASVSGVVRAVGVYDGGDGYTEPPEVSFSGGSGSGASATAIIRGRVTKVNVTSAGGNYSCVPNVEFSKPGIPAEATLTVSGNVSSVVLRDRGCGYSTAPEVIISGGGGSGATAEATLSAHVSRISIDSGGGGYASPPTVAFSGGGGSGAAAQAVIAAGRVQYVRVTSPGGGYTSAPEVSFSGGGGSGATAKATIQGFVSSVTITHSGEGYSSAPLVSFNGSAEQPALATVVVSMSVTDATLNEAGKYSQFFGVPSRRSLYSEVFGQYLGFSAEYSFGENTSGGAYRSKPTASVVPSRHISSISVTSPGGEYTSPPDVRIYSATGSGAVAAAVLSCSVRKLTLQKAISGFTTPPVAWLYGGGGSGATAASTYEGRVISVSVMNGGKYKDKPSLSFSSGNAELEYTLRSLPDGFFTIDSVTVKASGSGYQSSPTVQVTGASSDTSAVLYVNMNYTVTALSLSSGGSGYRTRPSLYINGSSQPALITISGFVDRIEVVAEGYGYRSTPAVEVVGDGYGAEGVASLSSRGGGATLGVDFSARVLGIKLTSRGSGYTSTPSVSIATPDLSNGRQAVARCRCTYSVASISSSATGVCGQSLRFGPSEIGSSNANLWPWLSPPYIRTKTDLGESSDKFFFPEMQFRVACVGIDNVGVDSLFASPTFSRNQFKCISHDSQAYYATAIGLIGGDFSLVDFSRQDRRNEISIAGTLQKNEGATQYVGGVDTNGIPWFYATGSGSGGWNLPTSGQSFLVTSGVPAQLSLGSGDLYSLPIGQYDLPPAASLINETGTGCSFTLNTNLQFSTLSGGSNYTNVILLDVDPCLSRAHDKPTATCVVEDGSITSVDVTYGGTNLNAKPTVLVQGGGGSGAVLQAELGYSITAVNVSWWDYTQSGSYAAISDMADLRIVVSDEFEIRPAEIAWEKSPSFPVWSARVVSGGLYSQKPKLAFSPAGTQFISDSNVEVSCFVRSVTIANGGKGFDSSPQLFFDFGRPSAIEGGVYLLSGLINADKVSHSEMPIGVDSYCVLPTYPTVSNDNLPQSAPSGELFSPLYSFIDQGFVYDVFEPLRGASRGKRRSGITSLTVAPPSTGGRVARLSVVRPKWKSPSPPYSLPTHTAVRADG